MKTLKYQLPSSLSFDNCEQVDKELNSLLEQDDYDEVILDANNTKYISSAGLRVVLGIKKKLDNTSVINASTEVYDIFEMTGFTQLVKVKKAYKNFDVTGCPIIGEGAKGIVYRYNDDTVIKVYKRTDVLPLICLLIHIPCLASANTDLSFSFHYKQKTPD